MSQEDYERDAQPCAAAPGHRAPVAIHASRGSGVAELGLGVLYIYGHFQKLNFLSNGIIVVNH